MVSLGHRIDSGVQFITNGQMNISPSLISSIHKYISLFTHTPSRTPPFETLYNGVFFSTMLQEMDIHCLIKDPSSMAHSYRNIKLIHDTIQHSAAEHSLHNVLHQTIDVFEICRNRNQKEAARMFLACLAVGLESRNKEVFINNMLRLQESAQTELILSLQHLMEKGSEKTLSGEAVMLQKITELETENLHLQSVIEDEVAAKGVLLSKVGALEQEMVHYKNLLNQREAEDIGSPKCSKSHYETKEKEPQTPSRSPAISVIQEYEAKITSLQHEIQLYNDSSKMIINLEKQVTCYKNKYEEVKSQVNTLDALKEEQRLKRTVSEKEGYIAKLSVRVEELELRIFELQKTNAKQNVNLDLKSQKMAELIKEIESLKDSRTLEDKRKRTKEPLSEVCPSKNRDIDLRKEDNQSLLVSLEKSTSRVRMLQREVERQKRDNCRLPQLQAQNRKLSQIVMELEQSKGEQNDILVGCLFELRKKMKGNSTNNLPT